MKNFSKTTFIFSSISFGFLLIPCFYAAWAEDEGENLPNIIWMLFAKLFYILRFPTHSLLWSIIKGNSMFYFAGLFINCFFYGFITERLISLTKNKKSKNSSNNNLP